MWLVVVGMLLNVFTCLDLFRQLLDEFLRATSGYQGTEESLDEGFLQPPAPFLVPKPTKLLTVPGSSAGKHDAESGQSEEIDCRTAVGFWLEALNKHLPPTLSHPAPMVRQARTRWECTPSVPIYSAHLLYGFSFTKTIQKLSANVTR